MRPSRDMLPEHIRIQYMRLTSRYRNAGLAMPIMASTRDIAARSALELAPGGGIDVWMNEGGAGEEVE